MEDRKYRLRYLPLFEQDLERAVLYIANVLRNPDAAFNLVDDVEAAILERLDYPLSFEPYPSTKKRKYPYYSPTISLGQTARYIPATSTPPTTSAGNACSCLVQNGWRHPPFHSRSARSDRRTCTPPSRTRSTYSPLGSAPCVNPAHRLNYPYHQTSDSKLDQHIVMAA